MANGAGEGAAEKDWWRPKLPESTEVMVWDCQELDDHARKVVAQTFERLNVLDVQAQDTYFNELAESISNIRFQSGITRQSINFLNNKAKDSQLREYHSEQALGYAFAVREEFREIVQPLIVLPSTTFKQQSQRPFQRMLSWLVEAQRNLATLDVLINIKNNKYTSRATKGGHSRARPASEKDQRALLKVMIKGLFYGDPKTLNSARRNPRAIAHNWAEEIYKLNRRFHIFNWNDFGTFQKEVLTLLLEHLKAGEDISDRSMIQRLSFQYLGENKNGSSSNESSRDDIELAYNKGAREAIRNVLALLLEKRFGRLPDAAVDSISSTSNIDKLLLYLDQLPEASCWQDVFID